MNRFIAFLLLLSANSDARKFYNDDPLLREPKPLRVAKVQHHEISNMFDFLQNTFAPPGEKQSCARLIRAGDVNTLGEVPDSAWYHNQNTLSMPLEEIVRGPGNTNAPSLDAPWQILSAKTEGVTAGFQIKDGKGRKYLIKFDPPDNPELATSVDVISSKFFFAFGYYTPENYIVRFTRSQIAIAPDTTFRDPQGRKRPMKPRDVDDLLENVSKDKEGRYRAMASLFLSGDIIGPFRYYGVRLDDPNDVVPHEHRRDLRGLYVFAAWLNHTDAKSLNSLDCLVSEGDFRYVKHHLIDFGASMGSDSVETKRARAGNEYFVDLRPATARLLTLGVYTTAWERFRYPNIRGVGNFQAKTFDPEKWKSNYPNPAFDNRLPDDEFWAARKVMALRDEQIRAVVETGEYSDTRAAEYITSVLIERRDKIGKAFFAKVLPLVNFEVRDGRLAFDDLNVLYNFAPARAYQAQWSTFDNQTELKQAIAGGNDFSVPPALAAAATGRYFSVDISASGDRKTMTVYLRKRGRDLDIVGIDRRW
jgi:hypothetical protein